MAKIESYTYSAKKDGLFKTKFFENNVGRYDSSEKEIDFNSRFKNTKIKYNFDKDPFVYHYYDNTYSYKLCIRTFL